MDRTLVQKKIEKELKPKKINQVEPSISNKDILSVSNYLKSGGWITEHQISRDFEERVSTFANRKYGIVVPNGTIALYLALLALGVGPGVKVAVPNITMIATINAILWTGAKPVIVDVDESLCLSLEKLSKVKKLHTVIFVPLNGREGQGKDIEFWCKKNGINLLEDSAHALGSNYKHKRCGSLGEISVFSFTPHKIITTGQGGMILLDKLKYKKIIDDLKLFNRSKDKSDWHKGFGLNFKFTDLQASLGLSQFDNLEKFVKKKKAIANIYKKRIKNENLEVGTFSENETPWFFDVQFKSQEYKKNTIQNLSRNNIETRESYPALSKQKYLKDVERTDLSTSEKICNTLLWLPSSHNLKKEDIYYISDTLNSMKD
jgi:perosamine synthetase